MAKAMDALGLYPRGISGKSQDEPSAGLGSQRPAVCHIAAMARRVPQNRACNLAGRFTNPAIGSGPRVYGYHPDGNLTPFRPFPGRVL